MSVAVHSAQRLEYSPQPEVFTSPQDWRDQFIYFLLVDRFDDDNESRPPYDPAGTATGRDPNQRSIFQGGNLKGITRRLDYIRNLGCTAVWLSPVLKNRQEKADAYHGYGIQDFLEVDRRFGTFEDLRTLVQQAHSRGMYIILDIILNHTGDNWAYPGDNSYYFWREAPGPFDFGFWREKDPAPGIQDDDAVWPNEFQNPDYYKRRGQIVNWDDRYQAINGDFISQKELDLKNSLVLSDLVRVYKYWIAAADIDGFRIDTVKHMEHSATAIFCNAIREYAKRIGKSNFFLFGEIVGDDKLLSRYVGHNSRIPGTNERFPSLDACLDFPLYGVLEEVIKGFKNPTELRDRYERFKVEYADHGEAGRHFVTFVDNHDQMFRKHKRFLYNNPHKKQMVQAMAYLLTSQGVPCIYYGSEQGFDGGIDCNDPANKDISYGDAYVRECMFGGNWGAFDTYGAHFFNDKNALYAEIARLAGLRAREPSLRYGRQYFREISGNGVDFGWPIDPHCTLAYSRILDTEEVLTALNTTLEPRSDHITVDRNLTPPGSEMINLLEGGPTLRVQGSEDGRAFVQVPLDRHGIAILKRKL
jgi:glycosidase